MDETKETQPIGNIDYPKEYKDRVKSQYNELNNILHQKEDFVKLGPSYNLKNSKGEDINVDSLFVDYKDKYNTIRRKYYIYASDSNGNILGDRYSDIREIQFKGTTYYVAEGMLTTGKRGAGVSSVIESVHMDILQRETVRLNARLDWHISNRNLEELREMEEEFRLNPSEELKKEMDNQRIEQSRWQAVYGIGGKLKFDSTGVKSFSPENSPDRYKPASGTIEMPPENTDDYNEKRRATVDKLMKRMERVYK